MKAAKLKAIHEAVSDFYGEKVSPKDPIVQALLKCDIKHLNSTHRREAMLIRRNLPSYTQVARPSVIRG